MGYVFSRLGLLVPKTGGPVVYAASLSPILGFQTGILYWLANWVGNLAVAITGIEYLSFFYPALSTPVIGGIATNFIFDKEKPLLSIVKKDDEIHVSCRGNQYLVSKGLDLGLAMNETAKKLDGQGGGHKIAAGATIISEKEEEFLDMVDTIITKQLKG